MSAKMTISSIDTGHASIEHEAKTDSDRARPPGGDHPATQRASPGVSTRSTARRGRSAARHARSSPSGSKLGEPRPEDAMSRTTRRSRRSGPAEDRSRRTGRGSGPTTSIRSIGGALTDRMVAETLRVRADIVCVTHKCICTVTTARKW
jgi:hypothetical protein